MARVSKSAASKVPWWLGEGDEECPHCSAYYVLQVEVRCAICDGPMCSHCKVKHAEGLVVCPNCVEESLDG